MPHPFREQFAMLDRPLERFFAENERITVCVGSGVSRTRMPLLPELIARGFCRLGSDSLANDLFKDYSGQHLFAQRANQLGFSTSIPCTLDDFRSLLSVEARRSLCCVLCENYGNVFQALLGYFGEKRKLLEAIGFEEFQGSDPDSAHCYIAFLIIEGKLQRLVTANWDRLIEAAIERFAPGPHTDFLKVIKDQPSWIRRQEGVAQVLVKAHGCCHDFPDNCDNIVLTTEDLERSTGGTWRQEALQEMFNATVLVTGYSLSDYTFNVPFRSIEQLRENNQLDRSIYYISQEGDLSLHAGRLVRNDANKHIRLDANDLFSTMFYGWVRARLREASRYAREQTFHERPFCWTDDEWNAVLQRVDCFLDHALPEILDLLLGPPTARDWDSAAGVPVAISNLRRLFLDGKVTDKTKYQGLHFEPLKDIVLLVMVVALDEAVKGKANWSLDPRCSHFGLRLLAPDGGSRQVLLLYGSYPGRACGVMRAYLEECEEAHEFFPSPEIVIVPCHEYQVPNDDGLEPGEILRKRLPGTGGVRRRFIPPSDLFKAADFQDLVNQLAAKLEV